MFAKADCSVGTGSHQFVIVLLDGKPNDDQTSALTDAADALRAQATVAAIGYSAANDGTAMARLASDPTEDWVYTALELDTIAMQLTTGSTAVCEKLEALPPPPPPEGGRVPVPD